MTSLASWRRAAAVLGCIGGFSSVVSGGQASQQPPSEKDLSTVIEMLRSSDPVVRVSVACARNVFNRERSGGDSGPHRPARRCRTGVT